MYTKPKSKAEIPEIHSAYNSMHYTRTTYYTRTSLNDVMSHGGAIHV